MPASPSGGAEERRASHRTREVVLTVAESLFAEHGYDGTSLAEIGAAAGLSRGTPGYFFGSKEQLYRAVLEQIFGRAAFALAPLYGLLESQDQPAEEIVRQLVAAHVDVLAREPALARLIQWEMLDGDGRLIDELAERATKLLPRIQDLSERLGSRRLDHEAAIDLLLGVAALCWSHVAHRDAVERALGRNTPATKSTGSYAELVADFVLARLS